MELEIDLVTKSAMHANARAARGREAVENEKIDKVHAYELESQIAALQEWATAAAIAKEVTMERNQYLERQLQILSKRTQGSSLLGPHGLTDSDRKISFDLLDASIDTATDRLLWGKNSSIVVGAG